MALPSGADVELGGVGYKLDQSYERITGRRCYVHGGRSIFAGRTDITGRPGAQNLKEDMLVWSLTRFDGEGQVVLDPADEASAFRFYRSEGLDFRTPGEGKLLPSILAETVKTTTSQTVVQGSAFTDVSGTSTTVATNDQRLNAVTDQVIDNTGITPGAVNVQVDFHIYRDAFGDQDTIVQGSALVLDTGQGEASGTDFILQPQSGARTTSKSVGGGHFTAGVVQRVEFYYDAIAASDLRRYVDTHVYIIDVTAQRVVASKGVSIQETTSAGTPPKATLNFKPIDGHDYRFLILLSSDEGRGSSTNNTFTIDKIVFGPEITENKVLLEIYNSTDASVTSKKTVTVQPTSATDAQNLIATLSFTGVAGKTYKARVKRSTGQQRIYVDKVVYDVLTAADWVIDCLDFGLSSLVWLGAHAASGNVQSRGFTYDITNDDWDAQPEFNDGANTYQSKVIAMDHSDSLQYFLLDSDEVYTCTTTAASDDRYAYFSANTKQLVGMTVAQNRLWLLSEDASAGGSTVYSLPLDDTSTNPWNLNLSALSTGVRYVNIPAGSKTADANLRQRMCSTPTGARFFLNYTDATSKVYEVDGSGTTLAPRELADLGHGVKATAIAYEAGITFVAALYYGNTGTVDTATRVDLLARPVLFAIDQNGVVQRVGFMRRDDPASGPVRFMVPYQTDLYLLQGGINAAGEAKVYIWRYSLVSGGLFLEYELEPLIATAATGVKHRALSVINGRLFAALDDEVFVAGSVETYRQSSVADGNSLTSSIYDFGLPAVRKALARIDVTTDELAANASVKVEYQTDQNGTWNLAGIHSTGSAQSFYATETTFSTLQLRATLISEDGSATPVLRGMTVWASAAEDEEYFDLVLLTSDQDSSDPMRIANEQDTGASKSRNVVGLWRRKAVTTFRDGYAGKRPGSQDYLVTIEDLRVEQNDLAEGRTVVTLRVVR